MHYAEQPSAPYSLMNYKYANITISNNLLVTNNLMFALRDLSPDTHVVHIGTMGEYGTPNIDIEEGWIEIAHKGRKDTFLYPRQASSLYHTTKIMDTDLMWFAVRMWGLRVTDLMQGPVYGIETEESEISKKYAASGPEGPTPRRVGGRQGAEVPGETPQRGPRFQGKQRSELLTPISSLSSGSSLLTLISSLSLITTRFSGPLSTGSSPRPW